MKYWATISEDEGVYGFEIEADGFPQAMQTAAHLLRRKEQVSIHAPARGATRFRDVP